MAKIKPNDMQYDDLISEIHSGIIKVPAFQRNFVWNIKDTISLLDSIYRMYPIGSFLFWETNDYIHSLRNIGNLKLQDTPEGRFVKYILDGQQRITSLYAALRGAEINGKKYVVYFDLDDKKFLASSDFEDGQIDKQRYVTFSDMMDPVNHGNTMLGLSNQMRQLAFNDTRTAFVNYPFSFIMVKDQPLEVVCEIFERVNTKGKKLTVVDLMVAKTWSETFDLRTKLDSFRKDKLVKSDYGGIDDISILQSISSMLRGGCRRAEILSIEKDEFAANWVQGIKAVELAIDFLRNTIGIPISRVLPFSVEIVPLAYFYFKNSFREPNNSQSSQLAIWFWRASLSNRYDSSVETRISEDLAQIDKILKGEEASFNYNISLTVEKIKEQDYSLRNAFCLTIMSLYASFQPKHFRTNALIDLTSKNFSSYNSKEMHHIFPKGYFTTNEEKVNSIANICFIPAALNKHILKDAPKKYFNEIAAENDRLKETLDSHLIGDLDKFGIESNNFELFLTRRADKIKEELERKGNLARPQSGADNKKGE